MPHTRVGSWLLLALCVLGPVMAVAQPREVELRLDQLPGFELPPVGLAPPTVEELAAADEADRVATERLGFIEQRLREAVRSMKAWYPIWTAGYAAGSVIQTVRAGFETRPAEQVRIREGAVSRRRWPRNRGGPDRQVTPPLRSPPSTA